LAVSGDPRERHRGERRDGEDLLALAAEVTEVAERSEQPPRDLGADVVAPSPIWEPL
jgi:hypothetical protein